MMSFFSCFFLNEDSKVFEIVEKRDGSWTPVCEKTMHALRCFAQQLQDAEGAHEGFDPTTEVLLGATYKKGEFSLQIRADELISPISVKKQKKNMPATIVVEREGIPSVPLGVCIVAKCCVDQKAFSVLEKMEARPSGERVVFGSINLCAQTK